MPSGVKRLKWALTITQDITTEYSSCQERLEIKLEVIGGAGVRGGKETRMRK